jgi:hypothetical protein
VDAVKMFLSEVDRSLEALLEFRNLPELRDASIAELNGRASVVQTNLTESIAFPANSVDLIVTSPPYPNTTDYTTSQRLSLTWLLLEPDELKNREIGARWKRFRKNAVQDYTQEIKTAFQNALVPLKDKGYCCVVVGDSTHKGKVVPGSQLWRDLLRGLGLVEVVPPIVRTISRQRLLNREARLSKEFILIFRRG